MAGSRFPSWQLSGGKIALPILATQWWQDSARSRPSATRSVVVAGSRSVVVTRSRSVVVAGLRDIWWWQDRAFHLGSSLNLSSSAQPLFFSRS
ncbi:unnamed protein product [Calypogeia fissa]